MDRRHPPLGGAGAEGEGQGSVKRAWKFAWTVVIACAAFIVSPAYSAPSDTVIVCRLITEKSYSGRNDTVDDLLPKPRQINEEFVLKFNDVEQNVTYIAGPAIVVAPTEKFNFENAIYFLGDSVVVMDGLIMRYSGEINRLTGNIILRELYLGSSGNRVGVFGNFRAPEACM